ncbi:TPA: hypothetical protein NR898_002748, partial [Listeria innocua]|nr:hypothetical protein [Listeria innocua]
MKITRTKRLVLMLLILVLLYLLMYSLTNDWKTSSHKHKETTIITNLQTTKIGDNGTITKQTITNDDSEDVRLSYYSTIEDAVKINTFAKDSDAKDSPNLNKKVIKEKVLLLENEKNAILFFIGNVRESNNHKDSLVVYKFKVKEEGSTKKYSTPTNATQISGVFAKNNYEIRD